METTRIQVKDELERILKYAVDRAATDLETTRGQSTQLTKEIKDKRKKKVHDGMRSYIHSYVARSGISSLQSTKT